MALIELVSPSSEMTLSGTFLGSGDYQRNVLKGRTRGIKKRILRYCSFNKKKWNIDQENLFSPMNLDPTT